MYCQPQFRTLHISTFVVTCSLIWVCMIKSEESNYDELCNFAFAADCHGHPELSFPSTYFGNCVVSGGVSIKRSLLVGENGIIEGVKAIEREVRNLKSSDILKKAETFMSDLKEFGKSEKSVLIIAGSPKLALYDTNFWWGRPKKSELLTGSSRTVSLSDCRKMKKVGLKLD
ncbi:hypothetical protein RIF29_05737 [Crotalaria pallida]|uniref:Uncharacterized protein n=1 Tax=Crotalaria pallida TaxID=3830 RepID=A0AAN9J2D1_CROPI